MSAHVVIVGAGHGGGGAVAALRQCKFDGRITLIGDEALLPYHRPPLSKGWLKGEVDGEALALRAPRFYAEAGVETLLSASVDAINRDARAVVLADGRRLEYDHLILATGAHARPLMVAGAEAGGILALRNAADADRLKLALQPGARLAVVGGGYIGLEVAASARSLGADVVVIEREARVLARVASAELSAFFQAYHEGHGVKFMLHADVDAFETHGDAVTGVVLRGGTVVPCDAALVGIGAIPTDHLARAAGLDCEAGVVVDENGQTSDPAIFAVGDVTYRPMPLYDRMGRLESVPNASEQARRAAACITGVAPPALEVPWFWSDQYDLKLQIAGVAYDADDIVVRGTPSNAGFAVFHLKRGRVLAVEAVNSGANFIGGKRLIGEQIVVDRKRLSDVSAPLKSLYAAA